MKVSNSPEVIWKALSKFQGQVQSVRKDARNPHFKNTYATLEAVLEAVRGPLEDCGLMIVQTPGWAAEGKVITVTTRLVHVESGEWIETEAGAPVDKAGGHPTGSIISYLRRYSINTILCLVMEDDDGNAASPSNIAASKDKGYTW